MKRGRFFWSLICACMVLSAAAADQNLPGIPAIRGWRGKTSDGMRIDHIWCSLPVGIAASRVVFNGTDHPVVSDHYGVMIETQP